MEVRRSAAHRVRARSSMSGSRGSGAEVSRMHEPIRVALVDDHHVVRRGLRSYLESFADLTVVGEAASGEDALAQIEGWLPDVVVMDIRMPGGIDGIEATRHLRLRA